MEGFNFLPQRYGYEISEKTPNDQCNETYKCFSCDREDVPVPGLWLRNRCNQNASGDKKRYIKKKEDDCGEFLPSFLFAECAFFVLGQGFVLRF